MIRHFFVEDFIKIGLVISNKIFVQGAAFSMVLRGTEKTIIDRKKVANVF